MAVGYETPHNEIPSELRERIEVITSPLARAEMDRLNTPVPGNPHGGFPGVNINYKATLMKARRAVIDQWNKEHPE